MILIVIYYQIQIFMNHLRIIIINIHRQMIPVKLRIAILKIDNKSINIYFNLLCVKLYVNFNISLLINNKKFKIY